MPDDESELNAFPRELANAAITPANVGKLNYWLAGVIIVVTTFIVGGYLNVIQDEKRDTELSANVAKQSDAIAALNNALITISVGFESHRGLHQNDQDDNDRRFMEIITRLDEAIGRIR